MNVRFFVTIYKCGIQQGIAQQRSFRSQFGELMKCVLNIKSSDDNDSFQIHFDFGSTSRSQWWVRKLDTQTMFGVEVHKPQKSYESGIFRTFT